MIGNATNAARRRQADANRQAAEIIAVTTQMPPMDDTLSLTSARMGVSECMKCEAAKIRNQRRFGWVGSIRFGGGNVTPA